MNLESAADELYAGAPEGFVERRAALAGEARAAGDRPLAKAIGQLRRPTVSAWIVNLLARESADEVQGLLDLGAALGEAQRQLSGPDLRRLSAERRAALDALSRHAVEIAARHDHPASEAARQEVSQTLQAALADPSVAELVRRGRLVQPASYGGFGPIDVFGSPGEVSPAQAEPGNTTPSQTDASAKDQPAQMVEPDPARQRVEQAVRDADRALQQVREEAGTAEAEAEQTTTRADDLADQVESLRAQLREAETSEREARDAARTARKRHQQLQQEVRAAEHALVEAQQGLANLD